MLIYMLVVPLQELPFEIVSLSHMIMMMVEFDFHGVINVVFLLFLKYDLFKHC